MHDAAQSHQSSAKAHRPSTPTVFGAAFVAGAVAAFGINSFFDAHVARTRPQVESEPIFVALRSLPQGAPVTVWDVGLRAWPRAMLPETALRAEDRFEGLILRHPLREGQPLLSVQLAQPVAAADIPGGERVEEAFAAPVPAADAAATATPAAGPDPTERGLATIAPLPRDEVEVFAPVERFEPAVAAARPAAPAIESFAATPAPVAEPVFEPVTQPTTEPVVTPVEQPAVEPAEDLVTTAPVAPGQPVVAPATPADLVETTAPFAPVVEPVVTPADTVAAPTSDAAVDDSVSESVVTTDAGVSPLTTNGTSADFVRASPEAVDAPPLLAATVADPPADVPTEPLVTDAPLASTPVQPFPPVDAAVRVMPARPLVPPTPGSDIEASLATISRQQAAQVAASRPGSVIAAADPLVPEQAPVPALPPADVAMPLATIVAAHPAPGSPASLTDVAQETASASLDTTVSTAARATPTTAPAPMTEVVATPDADADRDPSRAAPVADTPAAHPPLRHLVVPERIAMQAEASFVAPRPVPTDEPTSDVPTTATSTATKPVSPKNSGAAPRVTNSQAKEPRGDRAAASTTQARPAESSRSTGGPVMRAIGSLFQGFGGQTSTEQSQRR